MKRWSDDQKILIALEKLGGNASAQELSDYIAQTMHAKQIPARTIRYRLSTMMERGLLLPSFLDTDERKVGLGEGILLLDENPKMLQKLEHVINRIPIFHWHVPTHGKYDGYLVHTAYDITAPEMVEQIAEKLQDAGLIRNFEFFDIVMHHSKKIDFSLYHPKRGWSFDWNDWRRGLESIEEKEEDPPFEIEVSREIIEYDSKDILLLRVLRDSPDASMTSLASITNLPLATVRDRIHRLRKRGVIKGYTRAYGFGGDLLWISVFMNVRANPGGILNKLMDLPFPGIVLIENKRRFCLRMAFTTSDLKQFMDGFRLMQPALDSYSFQFHLPDRVDSKFREVFNLFDAGLGRWKMPVDDYIKIISQTANP